MKKFIQRHRKTLGMFGMCVALGIAAIYYLIVPREAVEYHGITRAVLTYGHSLCWALLAIASGLWALRKPGRLIAVFAYSALLLYLFFILSLL